MMLNIRYIFIIGYRQNFLEHTARSSSLRICLLMQTNFSGHELLADNSCLIGQMHQQSFQIIDSDSSLLCRVIKCLTSKTIQTGALWVMYSMSDLQIFPCGIWDHLMVLLHVMAQPKQGFSTQYWIAHLGILLSSLLSLAIQTKI